MKYFTLEEFTRSDTATRMRINNTIPESIKPSVVALVDNVLDPLRQSWGRPLTVTSGYRCPALNKAVGGVANSHHLYGQAADITTGNAVDNRRLFQLVLDLALPFTQLIDEHNFAWVHISYNPADLRHEIKRIR